MPASSPRLPFRTGLAAAALSVALGACTEVPGPFQPPLDPPRQDAGWPVGPHEHPLKVLTWNVYLGGDTGPLFTIDFSDLPAVAAAARAFWDQVRASDVPGRASAVADRIEAQRPHLVALQEAVLFAEIDAKTGQPLAASDLLASLQAELAARGLSYPMVAIQENTSSVLPLELDPVALLPSRVLAFTDRLVVLRRGDLVVDDVSQGRYAASFNLGPLELERGWIRARVEAGGQTFHVVSTHLETQGLAPVQAAQVDELLGTVLAGLDGVTVLVGDLNSDAAAAAGDPSWTPTYDRLRHAGFADAWQEAPPSGGRSGATCCQDPDLRNAVSTLDERIDFVLLRDADDAAFGGTISLDVMGDHRREWTQSGLWPSDHAGLAVGLRPSSAAAGH